MSDCWGNAWGGTSQADITIAFIQAALGTTGALDDRLEAIEERIAAQVPEGPVLVIPAPGPGQTVAWAMCYDEHGVAEAGVIIQIKLVTASDAALDGAAIEALSDNDGLATAEIPRGAGLRFAARRGVTGPWTRFGGVDAETLPLPALLGSP